MNILSYPMRYVTLRNEAGGKLYKRDAAFVIVMAALLTSPFVVLDGNFFGAGGLLDRVGTFASVLTGFYIAALVGVASLSPTVGDLDKVITQGPIYAPPREGGEPEELTRRQYVCSLFGYLAFVSLFLSISAIVAVVCSGVVTAGTAVKVQGLVTSWTGYGASFIPTVFELMRTALIIVYTLIISHIIATTCHGLYYYIDRIYAKEPTMGSKTVDPDD